MFENAQVLDTNTVEEEENRCRVPTLLVKHIRAALLNKGVQVYTVLNMGDSAYPVRIIKKDLREMLTGLSRNKEIPGTQDEEGNLWLLGVDFLLED